MTITRPLRFLRLLRPGQVVEEAAVAVGSGVYRREEEAAAVEGVAHRWISCWWRTGLSDVFGWGLRVRGIDLNGVGLGAGARLGGWSCSGIRSHRYVVGLGRRLGRLDARCCRLGGGRCLDGGRFAEREVGDVGSGGEGEGDGHLYGGGRGELSGSPSIGKLLFPGRSSTMWSWMGFFR